METSSKPNKNQPLSGWLKKLQRESWEMELLVSGFSIFLLIYVPDKLSELIDYVQFSFHDDASYIAITFLNLLILASHALAINLITHLILRGFWIGLIGLSSVEPEINFNKLFYSSFFTNKLKKTLKSLDEMISSLDNFCSIIFSFSFLIVLYLISLGLFLAFLILVSLVLNTSDQLYNLLVPDDFKIFGLPSSLILFGGIFVLVLISAILYCIDFFTLGSLKKNKFISKVYYPIYYFYGFITLSFLYRPVYYTFISKFGKKRVGLFLIPYFLTIVFLPIYYYDDFIYFPDDKEQYYLKNAQYDNLRRDDNRIRDVSINSDIISEKYLKLFIRYNINDNDLLKKTCPGFTPSKKGGFTTGMKFSFTLSVEDDSTNIVNDKSNDKNIIEIDNFSSNKEKEPQRSLQCLSSLYLVYINDSLYRNLKYFFYIHPNKEEKGIITIISTEGLNKGENILEVKKKTINENDEITEKDLAYIPFWVE